MLFKQSRNTFIRQYGKLGYVYNKYSKLERVYDETGSAFLSKISRSARSLNGAAEELADAFPDVPYPVVTRRFREFVGSLESEGFVIVGETSADIDSQDPRYSYDISKRVNIYNNQHDLPDTSDFLYSYFHKNPQIVRAQVDVTSVCNERCVHCYLPDKRERRHLDTELGLLALDDIRKEGALSVTFSGGEVFLHPDFDAFLRRARQNDLTITVLTNGTLIDESHIGTLKEIDVDEVQLSIYSMNPEQHDAITTVKNSHASTMKNAHLMMEAGIPLKISCPLMKTNQHSYKDVQHWAESKGISVSTDFILMGCTNFDLGNLRYRLTIEETEALISGMLSYNSTYKRFLEERDSPADPMKLANLPVCGAAFDSICLGASGEYYLCPLFRKPIGNARNQSLHDIWHNSPAVLEVRNITWGNFSKCMKCEAFHFCSMCFARNYNEHNGDYMKIAECCCDVAFLNKRLVESYWEKNSIV